MYEKLSKTEKIALVFIVENEVHASKDIAKHIGITEGYANNILTKLIKAGFVEKRYLSTNHNAVLSFLTPDDKITLAGVLRAGLNRRLVTFNIRRSLLRIIHRLEAKK